MPMAIPAHSDTYNPLPRPLPLPPLGILACVTRATAPPRPTPLTWVALYVAL